MLANVLKYRERRCCSVREDEENREVPNRPVIFHSLFDGNICQHQDCGSSHVCNEQTKNLIFPWNWNYEHNVAHGTSRCWSQVVRGTLTTREALLWKSRYGFSGVTGGELASKEVRPYP